MHQSVETTDPIQLHIMHQSVETTDLQGRAGDSGVNVLGFYLVLSIVPAVPGFCVLEIAGITAAHGGK